MKYKAKEMVKINWSKMHEHNYNGCQYCGGKCQSTESIVEWGKAYDELSTAGEEKNYKRYKYLFKKINEKLTYVIR